MIDMISFYKESFILLIVSCVALPLIGVHLMTRRESVKSLMLSQMATLGVFLGALTQPLFSSLLHDVWPLSFSFLFTCFGSLLMQNSAEKRGESFYLAFFIFYLACSYWILSVSPQLKAHHSQSFFGDIVTVYGTRLWISVSLLVVSLVIYALKYKEFLKDSFEFEVLGLQKKRQASHYVFLLLSLLVIVSSIYTLGMLFTLACLFIGPALLSPHAKSLRGLMLGLCFGTVLSGCLGFILSLYRQDFSTVPSIVLVLMLIFSLPALWQKVRKRLV